jgi:hypothetical protein
MHKLGQYQAMSSSIYIGSVGFSTYGMLDDGTVVTFVTTPDKPLLFTPKR